MCFEYCQVARRFSKFNLGIAFLKTILENKLEPFRSWRISSDVGYGWCVRRRASLGLHMFTHSRMSPFGLSTMTSGDTHGVGPVTCSMIS